VSQSASRVRAAALRSSAFKAALTRAAGGAFSSATRHSPRQTATAPNTAREQRHRLRNRLIELSLAHVARALVGDRRVDRLFSLAVAAIKQHARSANDRLRRHRPFFILYDPAQRMERVVPSPSIRPACRTGTGRSRCCGRLGGASRFWSASSPMRVIRAARWRPPLPGPASGSCRSRAAATGTAKGHIVMGCGRVTAEDDTLS
jgi:hypothetical protein